VLGRSRIGTRNLNTIEISDKTVVEYLSPDTKAVTAGYKSAQVSLPGNIDRTRKALDLIAQRCKRDEGT